MRLHTKSPALATSMICLAPLRGVWHLGFRRYGLPRPEGLGLLACERPAQGLQAECRRHGGVQKNFPARVAEVRAKLAPGTPIEVWCQDEMRVGVCLLRVHSLRRRRCSDGAADTGWNLVQSGAPVTVTVINGPGDAATLPRISKLTESPSQGPTSRICRLSDLRGAIASAV
jgi:hypothetical protein